MTRASVVAVLLAASLAIAGCGAEGTDGYEQSAEEPLDLTPPGEQEGDRSLTYTFTASELEQHGSGSGRYSCAECGQGTDNAPDAVGESLCSSCYAYYMEKNRRFQEQVNERRANTCTFCGAPAPSGKGMCSSCIREAARILEEG